MKILTSLHKFLKQSILPKRNSGKRSQAAIVIEHGDDFYFFKDDDGSSTPIFLDMDLIGMIEEIFVEVRKFFNRKFSIDGLEKIYISTNSLSLQPFLDRVFHLTVVTLHEKDLRRIENQLIKISKSEIVLQKDVNMFYAQLATEYPLVAPYIIDETGVGGWISGRF